MARILVADRGYDLLAEVSIAAERIHPTPEVTLSERPADLADVLAAEGPFDVLVAGPMLANRTGLNRLQALHEAVPALSIVLVLPAATADRSWKPVPHLREVVRTGAVDVLQLPIDNKLLGETIERALELSAREAAVESAADPASRQEGPGRMLTVTSATGGCGKTFYATNLACFLQRRTGRRTCLVDLDLQFGQVATALRLRPRYTIVDLVQREDGEADLGEHLEEHLCTHDTGIHVLAAPKDPSEADTINPQTVVRVLDALRTRFDDVVVDTSTTLNETLLGALDLSDTVVILGTLDVLSIRKMTTFVSTLKKLEVPEDRARLVLNKIERDVGVEVDQVAQLFPQGLSSVIPASADVSRSINLGIPILVHQPESEVSRSLKAGMVPFLRERDRTQVLDGRQQRNTNVLSRMFRRAPAARASVL
jgi:pilus assembly protein CpaE